MKDKFDRFNKMKKNEIGRSFLDKIFEKKCFQGKKAIFRKSK